MKIRLAGYNIDYETIMDIEDTFADLDSLTPETIAAAYARISRSPKGVDELRAAARAEVDKARASNETIVFAMGHSSIAEHAVFNVDVIGVSRLLVEEIERFRLCSFTEKSQRYVLLKDDYVLPGEIAEAGLANEFRDLVARQNSFYRRCYEGLLAHLGKGEGGGHPDGERRFALEGLAKEDARYCLSLATQTQLGMTANARNVELMIRRLAAHPLGEAREFARALFKATRNVAPSLIRYTEATDYDRLTRRELTKAAEGILSESGRTGQAQNGDVELIWFTPDADDRLAAFLLHSSSQRPLGECLAAAASLSPARKEEIFHAALRRLGPHDPVLREFEYADLVFELVVSASCFAQLKRHRMATLTTQAYDPSLGVTVPPAVAAAGLEGEFREVMEKTKETYERVRRAAPEAASYCLTNAHRRRVAMKVNARELYHMARLREDAHAQWDIRHLVGAMIARAREVMPLTMTLACGKDRFPGLFAEVFPAGGAS